MCVMSFKLTVSLFSPSPFPICVVFVAVRVNVWALVRLGGAAVSACSRGCAARGSEREAGCPDVADTVTRKEHPFVQLSEEQEVNDGKEEEEKEEEEKERQRGGQGSNPQAQPNVHKDDLARRRAQSGPVPHSDPLQTFIQASITQSDLEKWQRLKMTTEPSESESDTSSTITRKESPFPQKQQGKEELVEEGGQEAGQGSNPEAQPATQKDDLAQRRAQNRVPPNRDLLQAFVQASITQSDLEKWQRLKMTTEPSEAPPAPVCQACLEKGSQPPAILAETAARDDLASRRARANQRLPGSRQQRFVHFGPVTEIDQRCWEKLSIARLGEEDEGEGLKAGADNEAATLRRLLSAAPVATPTIGLGSQLTGRAASPLSGGEEVRPLTPAELAQRENKVLDEKLAQYSEHEEEEDVDREGKVPDLEKDDMLARRTGAFQKQMGGTTFNKFLPLPGSKLHAKKDIVPHSPEAKREATGGAGIKKEPDRELVPNSPKGRKEPSVVRAELCPQEFQPKASAAAQPNCDTAVVVCVNVRSENEDEENEEEELLPDLEKDDMHARRTGMFQKAAGPAFNSFLPMPGSFKYKDTPVAGHVSTFSRPMGHGKVSTLESSRASTSRSMELCREPNAAAMVTSPVTWTPKGSPGMSRKLPQVASREEVDRGKRSASPLLDLKKDDTWACRTLASPNPSTPSPTHFQPMLAASEAEALWTVAEGDKAQRRPSWLDEDLPPMSVSMIDMRCEEEAVLQPHSQTRHELMHNQYNKMREEEDHWQDDLARWKSRRRSASQDLIKKEEERKMMEKLMSGDGSQSHRRRSIKTYKEIVEEKERREQELHEAYRKARTPEEAAAVLQRYALRFTISEAVLERLQIPKQPERGPVSEPSASSAPSQLSSTAPPSAGQDTGAMKYLRQQSAPVPKFTSTVETTVGIPEIQAQMQSAIPEPAPARMALPKTVPLLTPKPYTQPRSSQAGLKSGKADGMVRVNGEAGETSGRTRDTKDQGRTEGASPVRSTIFLAPSLTEPPASPRKEPQEPKGSNELTGAQQGPANKTPQAGHQESSSAAIPPVSMVLDPAPVRPTSLPTSGLCTETTLHAATPEEGEEKDKRDAQSPPVTENKQDEEAGDEATGPLTDMAQSLETSDVSIKTQLSSSSDTAQMEEDGELSILSAPSEAEAVPSSTRTVCQSPGTDAPEKDPVSIPSPMLSLVKRVDHWSWDPEEERKRQERWQQEQERMLQEKYQREQEKLKQEWEKAQKEVEEEERRYHEEERRILEETVAPLTPRSSALPSPIRVDPPMPSNPQGTIVRSLADWERKQELLEEQLRRVEDSGHDSRTEHVAMGSTECLRPAESSPPQSSSQTEAVAETLQNGQRALVDQGQTTVPQLQFIQEASWSSKPPQNKQPQQEEAWNKTASLDRNWSTQQAQSGRMKRSGSCENVGTNPSQSSTFSSAIQSQSPNRSVSGKKLCSSCAHPLGKGAAMIIETLGLYFHIQCFKCGICKGQLGDTSTGTDVRIRNGLLNCHECYMKSRAAGQPTTL